jgi:alpha-aminoadipate carrier protein LysW
MVRRINMLTGICPDCDGEVRVSSDVEIGDYVSCPECGVELEILETDPLELDIVQEEDEEDYYDEEEEW